MSDDRAMLRELADRVGIVSEFWDLQGTLRVTSDATREALLAAMRIDASSEELAKAAVRELDAHDRERILEPLQVWRELEGCAPSLTLRLAPELGPVEVELELRSEQGQRHAQSEQISARPGRSQVRIPLGAQLPPGYHDVRLRVRTGDGARDLATCLAVAPRTALRVSEVAPDRAFGVWGNLYTLRSERNWGFGDLGDLAALARLVAQHGGDFVGLNPLHAIRNEGFGIAPYSPVSRLFRNVLYIDVEAVPELASCPEARNRLGSASLRRELAALRESDVLEHARLLELKRDLLRALHDVFRRGTSPARRRAYREYVDRQGEALARFACFELLAREEPETRKCGDDWMRWPDRYRRPDAPAIDALRRDRAEDVAFECWLQFEIDEQLGTAARAGTEAGLRIGLYQDLAVGSAAASADTWLEQDRYAFGASLGAPPDAYSASGQDWGLPPLDPRRLRGDAYRFFIRLLRSAFRHSGALRIDHVMGLQRQFWTPVGRPASEGAYVRQPISDLLGLLALESRRHGALVIGEDLGTVPPELPGLLASWGILSSSVLCFEWEGERFRPSRSYSPRALVTANTHDLAPLGGYVAGRDLELRHEAGQIGDADALEGARAGRRHEVRSLVDRLVEEGLMPGPPGEEPDPVALRGAVTAFLARTPSPLVAASLDDLAGETEPLNLPGVPVENHRSWCRRMRRPLEELARDPDLVRDLESLRRERGSSRSERSRS